MLDDCWRLLRGVAPPELLAALVCVHKVQYLCVKGQTAPVMRLCFLQETKHKPYHLPTWHLRVVDHQKLVHQMMVEPAAGRRLI